MTRAPFIYRGWPDVAARQMHALLLVIGTPLIGFLSLVVHRGVEGPAWGRRLSYR